jgi:SAM-dependent methyltransferase
LKERSFYNIYSTTEEYAAIQESCGNRIYEDFLKSYFAQESFNNVLDVGCGLGRGISQLIKEGYNAYGIDLPQLSKFWKKEQNDSNHFFCCDAGQLPFPDDFFDIVYSLGVIEHIGTKIGHCTLSSNYRELRQQFVSEILRVTKPLGRILISCPNKHFPFDIQHGPTDNLSPKNRFRSFIFAKTGINVHPIWGKYHLLSYSEVKHLFCKDGGARYFEPISLKGYFAFERFRFKFFKSLAELYIHHIPRAWLSSFLNPYVLVQIRK